MGGVTPRDSVYGDKPSDIKPTFVIESLGNLAVLAKDGAK